MWNNFNLHLIIYVTVSSLFFIALPIPYALSQPNVKQYWKNLAKYKKCGDIIYSINGAKEDIPIGITVLNGDGSNVSVSLTFYKNSGCTLKKCDQVISDTTCLNLNETNVKTLHRNTTTLIDCSCKNDNIPQIYKEKQFNRTFTRVVFSPYNKHWFKGKDNEPNISKWNNYTMSEIEIMLQVLATKFSLICSISEFGGPINSELEDGDWNEAHGYLARFVPVAGANVNIKLYKSKLPTINILHEIYLYNNNDKNEIADALNISETANNIFPGTVQGLFFTSDLVRYDYRAFDIIAQIEEYKGRAIESNIALGIRINICQDIIPKNGTDEFSTSELEELFSNLLPHVAFVICASDAPSHKFYEGVHNLVQENCSNFLKIRKILQSVKHDIRIIGQTGWPSSGISYFDTGTNIKNMMEFWNNMSDWAVQNSFELLFFEAFDEPRKVGLEDLDNFRRTDPFGSEGHYGWWRRFDNKVYGSPVKAYTYIPKLADVMDEIKEDDASDEDIEELVYILAVGVFIFLIFTMIIGALFWRLKKAKNNIITRSTQEIAKEFRYGVGVGNEEFEPSLTGSEIKDKNDEEKSFVVALKFPYDRKYELFRKKFQIDESWIIGRGNFGVVYRGKIDEIEGHVAFKTLNSDGSLIELKNLLSEIKIMSYVGNHPNIVNLLGAYTAKIEQGEVYVATEYCDLGNLEKYIKAQKPSSGFPDQKMLNYVVAIFEAGETPSFVQPKTITQKDLLKWAYQIASGMEYIASKKVIHSDLACRNVLLTKDENAKIADFGLSRQLYYDAQYLKANAKEELPWRWMSLESLKTLTFSIESDVWSYGILLWELFSYGDTPYPGVIGWNPTFLYELDVNDYKMDPPTNCPAPMSDLMLNCWDKVPSKRPTFTQLKDKINELYQQES